MLLAAPASAQGDLDQIGAELSAGGSYIEFSANATMVSSIDRANAQGIAFAWLDDEAGPPEIEQWAEDLAEQLNSSGSQYNTVLLLTNGGVAGHSFRFGSASENKARVDAAIDAGFDQFDAGSVGAGIDSFSDDLANLVTTATTTGSSGGTTNSEPSSGFGLTGLLMPAALLGGGYWIVRNWRKSKTVKREEIADMEADRAEIKEQLRDNADRVISLGDRVIESGNHELISLYEKASHTYRDVSHAIDGADNPDDIDRLDDQIDEAEWQFEVIEARLAGRTPPPSPVEVEEQVAQAKAEVEEAKRRDRDKPALGANESVLGGNQRSSQQRYQQRNPRGYAPMPRRRGGYGSMGGGLGGMLGSIILGQMGGRGSRRTQQRRGGGGFGGGGLGGGVLRPRGGSGGGGRGFGGGSRGGGSGRGF